LNPNTAGLHIALDLLEVKSGDEVCTVAITFVSTNHVILYKDAKPVFVDVDKTGNMCPQDLERKITSKTKAIIVVHLSGYTAQMDQINVLAAKHKIAVIEDLCARHRCLLYQRKKSRK